MVQCEMQFRRVNSLTKQSADQRRVFQQRQVKLHWKKYIRAFLQRNVFSTSCRWIQEVSVAPSIEPTELFGRNLIQGVTTKSYGTDSVLVRIGSLRSLCYMITKVIMR